MSRFKTVRYNSVEEINSEYWNILNCTDNIYYTPDFLKAYEISNKNIDFNYIFILDENNIPVAFANTQIVTIGIETITKNINISDVIKGIINGLFRKTKIRILFVGNVFLSGEYGTFLKQDRDKIETFTAIAKGVRKLTKATKKLHGIFVKDFKQTSLHITDNLKAFDYASMQVEPNMIIYLKPEWRSFDEYKNALKSKYRVKANKADSTSSSLEAKIFSEQDVLNYKNELQELYENTIANANFNAQVLDLNTYIHLKGIFRDKFIVKGYFLDNKLVGFLSAMVNQKNLDAHFIGLNYNLNKTYAIYPRILNDYVRLGIEYNSEKINLGRTASEIKSTLGAVPEPLMCYFKHKHSLINHFIKPMVNNIQIKTFKQHHPFK